MEIKPTLLEVVYGDISRYFRQTTLKYIIKRFNLCKCNTVRVKHDVHVQYYNNGKLHTIIYRYGKLTC